MASWMYDPQKNYGYRGVPGPWGQANSYMDTYPGAVDTELQPEAYFTHAMAQRGYGGLDNRSNLARNLYGRTVDAYGAARLKNNELKWKDFLDPIDFDSVINNMMPDQRGENHSNVVPYNVRWLHR
jgi:hypothetical protein